MSVFWPVDMRPAAVLYICELDVKIDILYKGQQLVKDGGASALTCIVMDELAFRFQSGFRL